MPEYFRDVLVTNGKDVEVKWLDEADCWDSFMENNSNIHSGNVTHWMLLPPPPTE
jgi:hypothetical protein